jgi:2,5-furandicarboxylate decarboxylase 1
MAGSHLHDLAAVIEDLDRKGWLARVRSEVDLQHELAGIAAGLERGARAVLFERVRGQGRPVLAGLYGTRARIAAMLGQDERALALFLAERITRWQHAPAEPSVVKSGPVLDVSEADVDLGKIPVPTHALKDAGAYFTAAVVIAKDPDSGARHAAVPRCQRVDRDTLNLPVEPEGALETFLARAKRRGRSLWFTLNVGVGPALQLAALAPAGVAESGGDALGLAGAIAGAPLELVPGTESDVEMAAHAMWALECEIIPGEVAPEGPFGAAAGYYTKAQPRPVAHVRRVHRRAAPVFQTILSGAEAWNCVGLVGEAAVLTQLRRLVPGVRDVHLTAGGAGLYHAVVQLVQSRPGWSKQAILAAFAAFPPLKMVTVVDEDIDIRDAREVEWAMATRLDAAAGIVTIDKAFGHGLNPSFPDAIGPKVGFDATRPLPKRAEYERVAFKSVALEAYDIAGLEAKPTAPLLAQPAAAVPSRAAAPEPEPARPAAPASDYDTDRIWQRELADWKNTRGAADSAPRPDAKPAASGARGVSSDWDENRWWKRELEEMQRERAGKASPAPVPKKAAAPARPSPARPAAPPRPPMPTRSTQAQAAEPRRIEARAGEGRSDDDDGSFFRGGAV